MTRPVETLIDELVAVAQPVTPLASPARRALAWLGAIAVIGGLVVYLFADVRLVLARYSGREAALALEMAAMAATGVTAIVGAFFLSIPGGSRRWLAAPLPFFLVWLISSGIGCYGDLGRAVSEHDGGGSGECLLFIIATSAALAIPLVWRLSRARPIDPLPVALLGGLGIAALSAFVLVFFHPFTVTFLDLAMHLLAILIVVAMTGWVGRRTLAPA